MQEQLDHLRVQLAAVAEEVDGKASADAVTRQEGLVRDVLARTTPELSRLQASCLPPPVPVLSTPRELGAS